VADRKPVAPLWLRVVLPLVVVAVALVFGSGVLHSAPETNAQRAAALESVIRCPSCTDVSVAQSDASTALAVRHEIVRQVSDGRTASQVEQTLVSQYGTSILLEPPDSAGFALIWIVPIVLAAATGLGVAILFWRRTRQFALLRRSQAGESVS
jgi:cytochrome c-type biogenesis protein CcmH/NrfF